MNPEFREIEAAQIKDNPFKLIGSDWMLVTAGTPESFNTMTASWGTIGTLWDKNICICFIRPTRYTYQFTEQSNLFTLSFFDEQYRDTLSFCGSQTGRNVDKVKKTGLTPVKTPEGSVYFAQARLVIECRKIYFHDLNPRQFLDPTINDFYGARDYHRMYIGEVVRVLARG